MPLHRTYFHDIAQPAKIQGLLEKLVDFTATAEFREYHPIKQAATVQHQFLQIFPFTEHCGKVGADVHQPDPAAARLPALHHPLASIGRSTTRPSAAPWPTSAAC